MPAPNSMHLEKLALLLRGMIPGKNIMKDTMCRTFTEWTRLAQEREKWRDAAH